MNKFILAFIFGILLIGVVSAVEWDNVRSYDDTTKTVTISNSILGIPTTQIATITLNTPTLNYVVPGKDRLVAEFTINNQNDYLNALKKIEFFMVNNGMKETSRTFVYKSKSVIGYKDIPIYETKCIDGKTLGNGTINQVCHNELTGIRREEIIEWKPINTLDVLKGTITIGIFTTVYEGDYVEWIPTFYGERINEWAEWVAGLNVGLQTYYSMTTARNDYNSTNLSLISPTTITFGTDATYSCKLGGCMNKTKNTVKSIIPAAVFTFDDSLDNRNASINIWFNLTTSDEILLEDGDGTLNVYVSSGLKADGWGASQLLSPNDTNSYYVMLTLTRNDTNACMWKNGTLVACAGIGTSQIDTNLTIGAGSIGYFDELGIWNRSLTIDEVVNLWNDGAGVSYAALETDTINISLTSPPNGFRTTEKINDFQFSINVTGTVTINNWTWYLWKQSDNSLNQTYFKSESSTVDIGRNYSATVNYGAYNWNVWGCFENATAKDCKFATTNRTITVNRFNETSQTFNNNTLAGAVETFSINITYDSGSFTGIYADFFYHNASYSGTKTGTGDNLVFTKGIEVPTPTVPTDYNFTWQLAFVSDTGTIYENATKYSQRVGNLSMGACEGVNNVTILNYTLKDEKNQTWLNDTATYKGVIDINIQIYSAGGTTSILDYSHSYTNTSNATICVSNPKVNSTLYFIDAQTRYNALGYVSEYHYLQNYSLNNTAVPQNIMLYDLSNGEATEVLATFKDSTLLPVVGAVIYTQRKYVGEGVYKTVEMSMTDSFGKGKLYVDRNNVEYKYLVYKNGQLLATFENIQIDCSTILYGYCTLSLYAATSSEDPTDFYTYQNLNTLVIFNSTQRKVSVDFSTIDGSVVVLSLNLTKNDNWGNQTLCSTQASTSSGSLSCTVPATYQNISFYSTIYRDGTTVRKETADT